MSDSRSPAALPVRPQPRQQNNQDGVVRRLVKQIPMIILIYTATQWLSKNLKSQPPNPGASLRKPPPSTSHLQLTSIPVWSLSTPVDVQLSLISEATYPDGGQWPQKTIRSVTWGQWDWQIEWFLDWKVPEEVSSRNESVWVEIAVVPSGQSFTYDYLTYRKQKLITRYLPLKRERKVHNLMASADTTQEEKEDEDIGSPAIISHYHPNVTFGIIAESSVLDLTKLPPILKQHVDMVPIVKKSSEGHMYRYPTIFPNDFWLLREQIKPINSTQKTLPLRIVVYPLSSWKFQVLASLSEAFERQLSSTGGAGTAEFDEIKRMLTETAPWLLITTLIVSLLHTVFEFLAFSSDVKHWKGKKELVGVSIRTIIWNIFNQGIILLYLMDNNENTSWMILLGQGVGLAIEAWKITKAVDIKVTRGIGIAGLPKIEFHDKHVLSEDEKKTQEYDALAFKYVSWVAIPCLGAYTVYSLIYDSHRGWYSFIISTLTSFTYAFGFVQLVPQLIINYKLKSVAHLPMKALIYKTLTTVVDDFFSFCIKMPTLHRLACFRDDLVFLILLYQYWIYKIDYSRLNEYGQGGVKKEELIEPGETESRKTR